MKRYFEVVGKRQVLMLELRPPADMRNVSELSEALKLELREIDRYTYAALMKKYTK
jgi:hypothetical protein